VDLVALEAVLAHAVSTVQLLVWDSWAQPSSLAHELRI